VHGINSFQPIKAFKLIKGLSKERVYARLTFHPVLPLGGQNSRIFAKLLGENGECLPVMRNR
jgi:hypothetical protein